MRFKRWHTGPSMTTKHMHIHTYTSNKLINYLKYNRIIPSFHVFCVHFAHFVRLCSGQVPKPNCHRPGVNCQLHVVTCTVATLKHGYCSKAVLRPLSAALWHVDGWLNLSALVSQSVGTSTHLNPWHTEGHLLGNNGWLRTNGLY